MSFGLVHVSLDDIVAAFPEFVEAVEECPSNCGHRGSPEELDCMLGVVTADGEASAGRLASLRPPAGLPRRHRRAFRGIAVTVACAVSSGA